MKKMIIFLAILLGGLFIFTSCSVKGSSKDFNPQTVQEKLDVDTVVLAVREMNVGLCETVQNNQQKGECKTKVGSEIIMKDAIDGLDLGKCEKISEKEKKARCKILTQKKIEENEKLEKLIQEQAKIYEFVENEDIPKCDELNDKNFVLQCKTDIYLERAQNTQDPSHCDNIEDDFIKSMCVSLTFNEGEEL